MAENLFDEIMAENFLNMKKEKDIQVQKAQSPKKKNSERSTTILTIIKMAKVKHEETILRQQEKNKESHTRESPYGYQLIFQQKLCRPEGRGMIYLN